MATRIAAAVLITIGLFVPASASAQTAWDVAGGYSFLQDPPDRINFPAGWLATAGIGLTPWLSVVGDVSRHSTTDFDIDLATLAVLGGVRASARIGPFVEYAQFLSGVVRSTSTVIGITSSESRAGIQPGAGVEYSLTRHFAVRGQFDYSFVVGAESPDTDPRHQLRYSALVAYHGCCR